jgi:hypothetical protein
VSPYPTSRGSVWSALIFEETSCLRMLSRNPTGKSLPGLPGIVTSPGLDPLSLAFRLLKGVDGWLWVVAILGSAATR